jgi:ABC-type transporter Mla subunit MlaD
MLAGAVFLVKPWPHAKFCGIQGLSNRAAANMSDDHPNKQRVLLIVGVVVFLLLLAGLFFGVQENPFRKPFLTFTVRFDDVSGIHERSKVTFLGIPAGYVKQLDYAPGNRQTAVKVQVVINRKLYIPAAVRAYLEPTLLGDASIALRVPPSAAADDTTGEKMADGAEIVGLRATKLEAVLPGFDETMAKVETFGTSAGQHLTSICEVSDRGVNGLTGVFLEKDADGQTKIDQLITSLEGIINGPEGQKDQSIRGQLEAIVGNLRASSESIRKLADVQGTEQGSIGEMLHVFEQTAKLLSEDAESTQKLIAKMGHTSEAVTQASEQVKNLAMVTTEAVEQFHSRPFHYLTTTRSAPAKGSRSPEASPRPKR